MQNSALAIANYFIELAQGRHEEIKPLRLMKLVYIAHGYMLAMLDKSVLNPRFDKVEAWRLGPVIPSVYHSFKNYRNNPITEKSVVFVANDNHSVDYKTPMLEGVEEKKICDFVYERYSEYTDTQIIDILHREGTPWWRVYVAGQNKIIPDTLTKDYYSGLVKYMLNRAKK